MAASSAALAALEAHLMRADYKKAFVLLEDVRTFLLRCYPSLEVKLVRVSDVEGGLAMSKETASGWSCVVRSIRGWKETR